MLEVHNVVAPAAGGEVARLMPRIWAYQLAKKTSWVRTRRAIVYVITRPVGDRTHDAYPCDRNGELTVEYPGVGPLGGLCHVVRGSEKRTRDTCPWMGLEVGPKMDQEVDREVGPKGDHNCGCRELR